MKRSLDESINELINYKVCLQGIGIHKQSCLAVFMQSLWPKQQRKKWVQIYHLKNQLRYQYHTWALTIVHSL